MKIRLQTILLTACFAAMSLFANAQKFGYLNSTELLAALPEVKEADSQLETYRQQLMGAGEKMLKDLETKYQAFSKEADSGALSQIQMQQKQGELQADQQEIANYEQEVQEKLYAKREELYKPILEKVRNTLDALAAEKGYTMIFDSSACGLLHAMDGDDVLSLMKAKLGI